jgi:sarcosine oxidase subunit delta
MLLRCPWCGPRELEEFRFRTVVTEDACGAPAMQDATPPSASTDVPTPHSGYASVYERDNVPGSSVEYWQHERGCRAWLIVRRNPTTAGIRDVRLLATRGSSPP